MARTLAAAGRQVVVTGSTGEIALAETVACEAGLPDDAVLAGHLDLTGLAALVAEAALVISNDTGVAHLATAYGTPSVVLFGQTSPDRWGPPSLPRHRALWAGDLHRLSIQDVLAAADAVDQA